MKAVSSWSLHRTLGSYHSGSAAPADPEQFTPQASGLSLLDLPAALRRHGYDTVQLCHFHLPSRDPGYLAELRSALADASITLDALLVDDGDLVDPVAADAHQEWISGWIGDAVALGATRARVIAGRQSPTPDRLAESGRRLAELADRHPDIRIVTENWLDLTPGPDEVETILDAAGGRVGLLIDLGNWAAPDKYDWLGRIARRAETCHAKCHFDGDRPDRDDFAASIRVINQAGYAGPLALVYDGTEPGEWEALETVHEIAGAGR
ncbi:sugar phosphate isomerase/epimerase family protein [Microlunatus parietis]|uniref:Sugar phosphate isomerase/epimerase n=1 Tax=Microlunatus parietis TaxID=682979 RepID=A0A7Y9L8P7_9ACTN|nr:TIM barrel protein [Microlunatus parietis]NYE68702.1 sugar phosphate isomerase/epimerase [Microlunatus parietis]